jgi:ornithine carbamoyltransferase
MPDFLDLAPVGTPALSAILREARRRRDARQGLPKGAVDADAPLAGHTLALIFEKASTRTRVSFEQAIRQLGGQPTTLAATDMQLGRGETVADTARVLSRYVDAIMLRTYSHATLEELAAHASVPVINGLTDRSHPCQLMADLMTVLDHRGALEGQTWAYLGDGNNMAQTYIEAASLFGFTLRLAIPEGYDPDPFGIEDARARGGVIVQTRDATQAVAGADVVVTDTWISMGQAEAQAKLHAMVPYQVDARLMAQAKPDALFLHCLPAHRGEEVTAEVIDGPQSVVWDEAENRIHAQKAILLYCLGKLPA